MAAGGQPFAGIDGLNVQTFADFRQGRVTEDNLTEMTPESVLIANNIVILADRMPAKRAGYTLVVNVGGQVLSLFDYQRDYDQQQYLIWNTKGQLGLCRVDGTGKLTLSSAEDQSAIFQYVPTYYALYMSNGKNAYGMFDNLGTPTLYPMGISAPATAPAVSLQAGTATTTYSWQYAYCWVRKITDSTGVTRYHIGPPSPLSSSTGPLTNQLALLGAFAAPPSAYWNFIWIFRTPDTPANSTSALYFDAEIPVTAASYGDANPDTALDLTRPIPYDNFPPQPGGIMVQYQGRIVNCYKNIVQASGNEEILLGINYEAFPGDLFFAIPGGKSLVSGAAIFDEKCFLCTKDFWWTLKGYDVETFKLRDKVIQPGAVGKKAIAVTPTHLVYLARDRHLYAWDGTSTRPDKVSAKLGKKLLGSLSMEDILAKDIENAEVRYYSFGRYAFVAVLVNTGTVPLGQFDWMQVWNAAFLGQTLSDGTTTVLLSETDFFFSDVMSASNLVEVGLQTYLFLGDPAGNIYRWPDGFQDNGKPYTPALGSCWTAAKVFTGPMFHPIPPQEIAKRFFYVDVLSDRQDCLTSFHLEAIVSDSPDMQLVANNVPLDILPSSNGSGPVLTGARGHLGRVAGLAVGKWTRVFITMPDDNNDAILTRFGISARPLYGVVP